MFRPLAAVLLVVVVGCAKTHYPVEGRVSFKGGEDPKKLAGGMVIMEPVEGGRLSSSRGYIRDDGRYVMGTLADDDGVVPGQYKVMVLPPGIPNPERPPPDWPPLKESYGRMDQSPFTLTVEPKRNVFDMIVD